MKHAREKFEGWIVASVALHAGIVLCVFVAPSLFGARNATWGSKDGGNGGVNVKIVSHIAGLALPAPAVMADDSAPKAKAPEKSDPAAVQLPSKTAAKVTKDTAKKPAPESTQTAPSNAVASGTGAGTRDGSPEIRYGQTATGTGPTGADFGGDATFGQFYGPYVNAMKVAITDAWLGANLSQRRSPRVYVKFTIARDGSVSGVGLEQETNSPTLMEQAAVQAVKRAKLPPLPTAFRGQNVSVRFYFDYAQ